MDFVSSEKKESREAIESDAILNGMRFCLEQKISLSGQRDVMALELYYPYFCGERACMDTMCGGTTQRQNECACSAFCRASGLPVIYH